MFVQLTITNPDNPDGEIYMSPGIKDGRIWINRQDGEGGDFDEQKVYDLLDKFLREEISLDNY